MIEIVFVFFGSFVHRSAGRDWPGGLQGRGGGERGSRVVRDFDSDEKWAFLGGAVYKPGAGGVGRDTGHPGTHRKRAA